VRDVYWSGEDARVKAEARGCGGGEERGENRADELVCDRLALALRWGVGLSLVFLVTALSLFALSGSAFRDAGAAGSGPADSLAAL